MILEVQPGNPETRIKIQGRIDTLTAAEFESKVNDVFSTDYQTIVFDCADMDYISSSGLRVFLMAQKKVSQAGKGLTICSLQPSIKEIFDISGFSQIFTIK